MNTNELEILINNFNTYTIDILTFIKNVDENSIISTFYSIIVYQINNMPLFFINKYIEYVMPYKQMIYDRNEQFFLNNELLDSQSNNNSANYISHIKKSYMELNDNNKTKIFDYFVLLCDIAIAYETLQNNNNND